MCSPMIAMAALAVASTAAEKKAQVDAGNAQVHAAEDQAQQQANQSYAQSTQQLGERAQQAQAQRARMSVAAGEAGVSGNSFHEAIADSLMRQSMDAAAIQKQAEFNSAAIDTNLRSATAGTKVNPAAAGLQIASAGVGGYYQGREIEEYRNRAKANAA